MAILDESKNPQARDAKGNPIGSGVASGIGAVGSAVSNVGSSVGSREAAPAPSGGGGGGGGGAAPPPSDGVDWATLAALSQAGLSSNDILALGSGGATQAAVSQGAATSPQSAQAVGSALDISAPQLPEAPAGQQLGYLSDPNYLAAIAAIDLGLSQSESGYRRQEDDMRRDYEQGIPMFNNTWDDNRNRVRNSYEARGLLKSGGTEDAVGKTYTQQGDAMSRMQNALTSGIGNLEQQIAQARAAAAQQRAAQGVSFQQSQPVT